MPRKPRFFLAGVPVHLVQRGNNRQLIFFDTADYQEVPGLAQGRFRALSPHDPCLCIDDQSRASPGHTRRLPLVEQAPGCKVGMIDVGGRR